MEDPCKRTISQCKLESTDPDIRKFWDAEFKQWERKTSLIPDERLDLLEQVFPPEYYLHLLKIWNIITEIDELTFTYEQDEKNVDSGEVTEITEDSKISIVDSDEFLNVSPSKQLAAKVAEKTANPYANFFKRRPDQVDVWRECDKPPSPEMNLLEQADYMVDKIAKNFVCWLNSLESEEQTQLSVQSIKNYFNIMHDSAATSALSMKIKEIPSVPEKVANARNLPELSKRRMLHREILKDKLAARIKKKVIAFGKSLPAESQQIPPSRDISKKWLKCEKLPEKIESMATVWQGITHLKATRAYCDFIFNKKTDIKPPKYLVKSGLMKSLESDDSFASFGNVSGFSLL